MTTAPVTVPSSRAIWVAGLGGLCGFLFGVGMCRFGYPPLIPAMIEAGWASEEVARGGAAAILYGYLGGALVAASIVARFGPWRTMHLAALLAVATQALSIAPLPPLVFTGLRTLAGIAAGIGFIAVPPLIAAIAPPGARGKVNGIAFGGLGAGFVLSGTVVPALARLSVEAAWIGNTVLTVVAASLALLLLADEGPPAEARQSATRWWQAQGFTGLLILHAGVAFASVPHTVLLVDHVARALGHGLQAGGIVWIACGLGALILPITTGGLADRLGATLTSRLTMGFCAVVSLVPALMDQLPAQIVAGFINVGFIMAFGAYSASRLREIVGARDQAAAWGALTITAGISQAVSATLFAALPAAGIDAHAMFIGSAAAFALGVAGDSAATAWSRRRLTAPAAHP
jgi:MFS family permease